MYDNVTENDLRLIAENFEFYHGHFTPEQADAIHKIDPEFKCTSYINSTYTQDNEFSIVESQYRDSLCMMLAAKLTASIDATQTQFSVGLADVVKAVGEPLRTRLHGEIGW